MKKCYLFCLGLAAASLVLILCGCDSASSGPRSVPQLQAVRAIQIEEDWGGFNDLAPVIAHYDLVSTNGTFKGTGFFSVGGQSGIPGCEAVTSTVDITIPGSAMHDLLDTLQKVRPEAGAYPTPSCCDDYASLKIDLNLPTEHVVFFSTSDAGEFILTPPPDDRMPWRGLYGHVPWAVTLDGNTYIVNSALPAQGLAAIDSYLRKDVWTLLEGKYCPRPR